MAVTKIKPVKSGLKQRLEYIQNPGKTDGKMLVSSFGCSYETADAEFLHTLSKAMEKGNNLAHHLIQSFEPGESTPEQAHEIGKRLADEILQGKYEYVLTTHIDKGHTHNHLIFCAASFIDNRKYISNRKSYYSIRNASDRLCKEYSLSVVAPGKDKGKSYAEYTADRDGGSWKSKLKAAIDTVIPQAKDFEDFLRRLEVQGYEIKRGKHISVRAPGQERFTRTKTLGADYTEDMITKRIAGEYARSEPQAGQNEQAAAALMDAPDNAADIPGEDESGETPREDMPVIAKPHKHDITKPASANLNLIVDIENSVKAQQSAGLARWQKIENLKEAAKTLNFLTENNLLRYSDLTAKADEAAAAFDTANQSLKVAESRLRDMAGLIKNITVYQRTKPVYDGLKTAKDKGTYRKAHSRELALHEAAAKALKVSFPSGKLPSLAALQGEYSKLTERKDALRSDYAALKKAAREFGIVRKNVDSILNPGEQRVKRRERGAEL
ncbi:endonuclease [Clostridia bacterium]|nr:endonuclease [Clostridia bacterium]